MWVIPVSESYAVRITYDWSDDDVIELVVSVSNGAFCGETTLYASHGEIPQMGAELAGFPRSLEDTRSITLGSLEKGRAGGGVQINLICTDRSGHLCADIVMCSEDKLQSVHLRARVLPAAIDTFVKQLRNFPGHSPSVSGHALLARVVE
jgi:hypothetical protein